MNETENSATVALQWEKLMIPFKIETDYIKEQITSFRNELRTEKGFIWQSWDQAAQWCLQHNTNLEEALLWTDSSTNNFGGERSFGAWSTRAQNLEKLARKDEAAALMKKDIPFSSLNDLHQYDRTLIQLKKHAEALVVFKMNFDKKLNQYTTLVGLVRGYSDNGDLKNALKFANLALPLAPDQQNKTFLQGMIDKLKAGKDANQ